MKKIIFALLAFFACMSAKAAKVTDAAANPESPTILYWSVDVHNQPILLSAQLFYKKNAQIKYVMVNCHPTITHDKGCPSGDEPQLGIVKAVSGENALVVCPDYIGFGATKKVIHPYMCSTLTARNVLDAYKAAIKHVKQNGYTIASNYYSISVGYSQGGATALAFHRYMETLATPEDQALVNLKGSVCGAGPYSQNIVFNTYEKWCEENKTYELDYPIYLLYCLQGHFEAFGQTTARNSQLPDCFTRSFWDDCTKEGGYLYLLRAKEKTVDELNEQLKRDGYKRFYDIINEAYFERGTLYRTIQKMLSNSDLLADGWTPVSPIIFYHDKAGNDIVVPYACTKAAMDRFTGHCTYVDAEDDYGYTRNDEYLWHAAAFRKIWDNMWTFPLQNTIMGIAAISGNDSYEFEELSHRAFGARFYVQFLAERENLRPKVSTTEDGGSADDSDVEIDIVSPESQTSPNETYNILAEEGHSTNTTAYIISTTLATPLQSGKLTLLQFASDVDGFYFGPDAERHEVILNDEGETISYRNISNTYEDFLAGHIYAVKSKETLQNITSITAGIQTKTITTPLTWCELNYRKLNSLGGKSYASAYLPFGYKAAEGADIYLVKESESEGFVTATKAEAGVSAGTGTLLISHSNAPLAVLEPDIQGEAGTEKGILTGCYTEIANDPDHYLLFGKSNKGNVGFWKYTSETVRPFSAFLDNSSVNEAKGVEIALSEDTDAIRLIDSKEATQGIYGIDGTKRNALQHGVNILRNTNGSVRKVIKK